MKNLILVLSAIMIANLGFANSESETKKDMAEKICEQGILSQKMVKEFMMIGANIRSDQARVELDESVADYEMTRLFFEDLVENSETMKVIDGSDNSWMDFRLDITDKVNTKNAYELLKTNETLLNTNKQLLSLSTGSANFDMSSDYIASKELEMLSQRIAMLYFAHSWGVQKDATLRYFSDAVMRFEAVLNELIAKEDNNIKISSKLLSLKNQWVAGKNLFGNMGFNRYYPEEVFEMTSDFSGDLSIIASLFQEQQEELNKIKEQEDLASNEDIN